MRVYSFRLAVVCIFSLFQWAAADNVPDVYQATWSNMSMGKSSQMMFYISNNKDFTKVTRAIIAIHGLYRDPWRYFDAYNYALNQAWSTGVDPASLVLMVPLFPNGNDKATASGANARPIFNSTNQLCWSSNLWAQGAPATNSRKTVDQGFTSHQALNALITYFGNKAMFPAMKEVVVSGHSAGAQLSNSWTVVGKPLTSPLALRTIVGAPGTFVWLDNQRPVDPSSLSCPTFNDYNYGLDNFTYGTTPTMPNSAFASLDIIYNYGSSDNDPNFVPADPGCEVQTQGNSHATRMQNYYASLLRIFGDGIRGRQRLTVNPGGGHGDYANQYSMWVDFFSPILSGNYPVVQSTSQDLGCFLDSTSSRALAGASTSSVTMDVDKCLGFCAQKGFAYAGVEYGQECYCGSTMPTVTNAGQCTITCGGNSNEYCGGANAMNVYQVPAYPVTPSALGCFADNYPSYRTMANASTTSSSMTAAVCGKFCVTQGYQYFGTEYGQECYCSDRTSQLVALPASKCLSTCAGNSSEFCGGSNALSVYSNIAGTNASTTASSSMPPGTTTTTTTNSTSTTSLVTSTRSATSSATSTPAPYGNATGTVCLTDGYPQARTLTGASFTSSGMTNAMCSAYCFSRNYQYAGTEYSNECYCGQSLSTAGGVTGLASTGCTMPCAGDSKQFCGGNNAVLVTTNPQRLTQNWQPLVPGCWADHYPSARVLSGPSTTSADGMTPQACMAFCWSRGASVAGVEYATQCFCGSALDPTSTALDPSACAYPCSGDASLTCGGSNALQVYNNAM